MEEAPPIFKPTPFVNSNDDKIKKEIKYELSFENKKYILMLNLTESNLLILKLKEMNNFSSKYYMSKFHLDDLNKLNKYFNFYESEIEVFNGLNDILKANNASIEKIQNDLGIKFIFPFPGNKTKEIVIQIVEQNMDQNETNNELIRRIEELENELRKENEENKTYKDIVRENQNLISQLKEKINYLINEIDNLKKWKNEEEEIKKKERKEKERKEEEEKKEKEKKN